MFSIGLNQMVNCFKVLKKDGVELWSSKLAHRAFLRIFCFIVICKLIVKLPPGVWEYSELPRKRAP